MPVPLNVTIVEINVYEGMYPLVAGYLQGCAKKDPVLASRYKFTSHVASRRSAASEILTGLLEIEADVYALSCYVWNMGLVKSLLASLKEQRPQAQIILGGPQVMNQASLYMSEDERTIVCNGEGERTFSNILRELLNDDCDLEKVDGITFSKNGKLVTTKAEPRIRDLEEIPSPFLNNEFEGPFRMSVIETNRGCPFSCGFCFWGAANNDKVFKFNEQRIRDEITWMSENRIPVIYIADANWGMLKRDVEFSQHIADCKNKNRAPIAVLFSSAKNSPVRVAEATRIFSENGLMNTQTISMQSLDPNTLDVIDRSNIKLGAFADLQDDLNRRSVGSYIELIWPLPGETLETFKHGIEKLCEKNAAAIIVYAHLLLHNTPIFRDREKHQLVTRMIDNSSEEVEIISSTKDVSHEDFLKGIWYIYAVNALHNTQAAGTLMAYLHHSDTMRYAEFLSGFSDYCRENSDHPFPEFCRDSIKSGDYYDLVNYPTVYLMVLHTERVTFTQLLLDYCQTLDCWQYENVQLLFELDLIRKPYLYKDTVREVFSYPFSHLRVRENKDDKRLFNVDVPVRFFELLKECIDLEDLTAVSESNFTLTVRHRSIPYVFNSKQSKEDTADYCSAGITRIASILPAISVARP